MGNKQSDYKCPEHGRECEITVSNLDHVTHHCKVCAFSVDVKIDPVAPWTTTDSITCPRHGNTCHCRKFPNWQHTQYKCYGNDCAFSCDVRDGLDFGLILQTVMRVYSLANSVADAAEAVSRM